MSTIAELIKAKAIGKPDCQQCEGKGSYMFEGVNIFCENCLGKNIINSLWNTIDGYLAKKPKSRYKYPKDQCKEF